MKKLAIFFVSLCLGITGSSAQVDRSQYPTPGPAPQINIGDPATFTLENGLRVFVVENHKLPKVTYSLILDRDPLLEGDKAGLTSLVGDMLMGGTTNRSKDELDEAIDRIGATISASSTSASASALKKYNDQLLELFTDVLFNPVFPQEELDKLKKQSLSVLAASKDDPNRIADIVRQAAMFGKDHPYGEVETEATIENIQVADIKAYYQTYFRPNIGYLAIVGDITVAEARSLTEKYFSGWQRADVPKFEWPAPSPAQGNSVVLVNRPASSQSVIHVGYPFDLKPNSPDVIAVSVLAEILGGGASSRLFQNLREDKGYTYGAYASIRPDKLTATLDAYASVRNAVTDSAVHEFIAELEKMRAKTISEAELSLAKASLAGSFGRSLENPATIARFAINTALYNLPKDYYKNYLKNLDAITVNQINELAARYIRGDNLQLTIVGKTEDFSDQMARFGDVRFYTVSGDPAVSKTVTDPDLTAEKVIERYLSAIGGREKLTAIRTLQLISEAEVQGMTIAIAQVIDKDKGIAVQRIQLGPQTLSSVRITREQVTATVQGQTMDLPPEAANAYIGLLDIFPELTYAEQRVRLELDGITTVNDEDAYKVKVIKDNSTSVDYFSVATGLKLKSESPISGESTINGYGDYEGIKLPAAVTIANQMMPVPVKAVTKSVVINATLSDQELQ